MVNHLPEVLFVPIRHGGLQVDDAFIFCSFFRGSRKAIDSPRLYCQEAINDHSVCYSTCN
jgi:hypothetical protein